MLGIWDSFLDWIKEFLISLVNLNLTTVFTDVNERVGTIAAEVGSTPQVFSLGGNAYEAECKKPICRKKNGSITFCVEFKNGQHWY